MRSALCIAVDENNYKAAELLIRAGVDVNEPIGYTNYRIDDCKRDREHDAESTSLHIAVERRNKQMIELLLSHGADVNACDSLGKSVLHTAVKEGCKLSIIEMLLKHGANPITASSRTEQSPLYAAISVGNMQVMRLLMAYGADPTAVTVDGNSLHMVVEASFYQRRESESYEENLNDEESVKIAKKLIDMGVDVNAVNRELLTPLQVAASSGKDKMIRLFLDKGARVNVRSARDTVPLLLNAVDWCISPATVKLLLSKGVDVNQRTADGATALHMACSDIELTEWIPDLLENGADINAKDSLDRTPFSLMDKDEFGRDSNALMMMVKQIDEMSFFHVFSRHESKIAMLLRNEDFKTSYDLKNVKYLFPIYASDLNLKMQRSLKIKESTMKRENYLHGIFSSRLPNEVIDRIAYFSKLDDFPMVETVVKSD